MTISASMVKTLREKTGVGLMACKQALSQANGDLDKALDYLREKGLASASKKAERSANEGRIFVFQNANSALILEINCETDFVASNTDFINFASDLGNIILEDSSILSLNDLKNISIDGKSLDQLTADLILKMGENIKINKFEKLISAKTIGHYVHSNAKIGSIVEFNQTVDQDLAKDIAMQVAAAKPKYLVPSEIPDEEKEKERQIIITQLKEEGKPDELVEKISNGKLSKFYKEICLLEQPFIKDDKKSIKQLVPKDSITKFICYSLS